MITSIVTSTNRSPISLSEAKAHLRIETTFTDDDDYITALINTAIGYVEYFCNRKLLTQTWETVFESWVDTEKYFISGGQLQVIVEISYNDENNVNHIVPVDDYIVTGIGTDEGRVEFVDGTNLATDLYQVNPIRIKYIAGFYQGGIWVAETLRAVDDNVIAKNGLIAKCTVGGTTGMVCPTWPATINETIVDGTATWVIIGRAVPDMIKQAILLLIAAYYENREPVLTIIKNTVDTLLLPYRIWNSTV